MAWLLLALPVTILVLLVVPVRVQLTFCAGLEWQAKLGVFWAFWKLRKLGSRTQKPEKVQNNGKQADQKQGHSRRLQLKPMQVYQLGSKYVPRLWRALHLRCDFLDIDILFSDPAMLGYMSALCGMNDWPRRPVSLSIGMTEEFAFDLDGSLQARLYPVEWILLVLRIAFEPPIRQLWWRKRKGEVKNAGSKDSGRTAGKPHFQQDGHRRSNLGG